MNAIGVNTGPVSSGAVVPVPVTATYRLQMRPDAFTFADAVDLVDYLDALGVSHLYLSPVLTAVDGSSHGYDVVDPSTVSAGLGGRSGLEGLAEAARARGMGLVIDIVPNHVGSPIHVRTRGGGTPPPRPRVRVRGLLRLLYRGRQRGGRKDRASRIGFG